MRLSPGVVNKDITGFVNFDGVSVPENSQVLFMKWIDAHHHFKGGVSIGDTEYRVPTLEEWKTILPCFTTSLDYGYEETMLGKYMVSYRHPNWEHTFALRFQNNPNLHSAWRWKYIINKGLEITIVPPAIMNNEDTKNLGNILNNQYFDTKIQENKAIKLYIIGGRAHHHTIIEDNTFARIVNASDCIMELYDYQNVCGNRWGGELRLNTSNRPLERQAPYQAINPYPLYLITNN